MSKYTMELRYLIQSENDKIGISNSMDSLKSVLLSYPIFDEKHREILNTKIMQRYYFREIGVETVPRFLILLNRKLNEIMDYYNQMYKSASIEFNPLWNVEIHETYTHSITGNGSTSTKSTNNSNGKSVGNGDNLNVLSDTPPQNLTEADIKSNKYASKTTFDKNNSTGTITNVDNNNGQINSSDNKIETFQKLTEGSSAGLPYSDAIKQWRNIMVNIDTKILDDLEVLFINLW